MCVSTCVCVFVCISVSGTEELFNCSTCSSSLWLHLRCWCRRFHCWALLRASEGTDKTMKTCCTLQDGEVHTVHRVLMHQWVSSINIIYGTLKMSPSFHITYLHHWCTLCILSCMWSISNYTLLDSTHMIIKTVNKVIKLSSTDTICNIKERLR